VIKTCDMRSNVAAVAIVRHLSDRDLGIGIAVNTIVFTLLNSLVLRPMPVRDPGRVVRLFPP
jgi:hypothetical protein